MYGDAEAVRHGSLSRSWLETRDRAVSLADALTREYGVGRGDCVQVMLHNTPEMLEAHFGVPMAGAVLGSINTRLDAGTVAYILRRSEAKVLIADADRAPVIDEALDLLRKEGAPTPHVLQALDPQAAAPLAGSESSSSSSSSSPSSSSLLSSPEYEALVQSGRSSFAWEPPADEFDALSLNYTSGSTGRPKGCVLHHRGAYLTALGNMSAFGGMASEGATRYLWTLPMFHCNGWNFPYTIAALGGLNIHMRSVDEIAISKAFEESQVTHLCGAPIVLRMAIEAAKKAAGSRPHGAPPIKMFVAASPPPAATLRDAANAGLGKLFPNRHIISFHPPLMHPSHGLILTHPHSSSLILTHPHSSSLILTHPHSSSLILTHARLRPFLPSAAPIARGDARLRLDRGLRPCRAV